MPGRAVRTKTGAVLEARNWDGLGSRRVGFNFNLPFELSSLLFINIVASKK
jgi:hypothetical protein